MKKTLIAGLCWLLSQNVLAEVSPQMIGFDCRNCHTGFDLKGVELNTLSREKIRQALLDFKYDKRSSTVMGRLAKGFSDSELSRVAQFISQARQ